MFSLLSVKESQKIFDMQNMIYHNKNQRENGVVVENTSGKVLAV